MSRRFETVTYPAVFFPGINFHVSAVIWILQQAVILKEQPGALSQTFTLVVMVLLDQFLHQLEQTLGVSSIPLDQVLRKTPSTESPPSQTCPARANLLLLENPLLAILHKSLILVNTDPLYQRGRKPSCRKDVLTAQRTLRQCGKVLSFPACECFGPSSVNRAGIYMNRKCMHLTPGRCTWHDCLSRVHTDCFFSWPGVLIHRTKLVRKELPCTRKQR